MRKLPSLTFPNLKSLKSWLTRTNVGQQILHGLVGTEIAFRCRAREQVLVVLEATGWVEVYGSRGVTVAIRNLIDVPDSLRTAAEEYLTATLPNGFRKWYWPVHSRAAEQVRRITVAEVAAWHSRQDELKAIRELAG